MSRVFLSTPSGWRATIKQTAIGKPREISIHALRVEGDTNTTNNLNKKFNISIHALRVEGDV